MNFSARLFFVRCLVLLLIFAAAGQTYLRAQSQTAATLLGTITDPRGAAVGDAKISIEMIAAARAAANASTDPKRETTSTSQGRFSLELSPGLYRITISHDSFLEVNQEAALAAGETRELQIHLSLEPLSASVIVTAETIPVEADSNPAPVTILTRQDIENRGTPSLPELLATQPGFSLGRTGAEGGLTSLFLDGANPNYIEVLVDGTPVNEPGGLIDFSNFTLDNIEKIEIVHGAESALYGSDAMAGVIQILSRRGTTRIPEFTAFAEGGNFSSGRGGVELSGLLKRFDYSASFADFQTTGQGPNDAFRNRTLSGNFGWQASGSTRFILTLRDNVSAAGTPGPILLSPPDLTASIGLHNFSAGLHGEFRTGSHWQHQVSGNEFYYRELNTGMFGPTFFQFNRSRFAGQSTYLLKGLGVTAGYEYEVENGFISYVGFHARRNNQAGFVDTRWQPVSRLTLNAGVRADDNANFGTRVVPRAGIAYTLRMAQGAFGDTRIHASYGQGIVEPRFDQTYGTDPCFPGNSDLLPERSRTLHVGVDQKLSSDRARISVDYFDNRFRNIISFQSVTPGPGCFFAGTYFNTNLARARGANVLGEARLARWLSASVNYTYDSTRTLSAPNNFDPNYIIGSRLLRRPVHSGNAMLNAEFLRMNWNLSGYFTARRDDYPVSGLTINPGYARFDIAGSYSIGHGVSFYGRIANLTNRQYQDVLGYPALGREFRIGMKYTTRHE